MVTIEFNGKRVAATSIEQFGSALETFDVESQFELWLSWPDGPSICMLRNGFDAFLMCLRFSGDSGVVSKGDSSNSGSVKYRLKNGQTDEYPASYSIPLEECYKALAYFYVNDGVRPDWVHWEEP